MSLIDQISKRNDDAIKATKKIISDYSDVFDEVFKGMCNDEMTAEWVGLDFHRNTRHLLDIVAIVKYRSGSIMKDDRNEAVYIDDKNAENYLKQMRVILPVTLVEDADIDGMAIFVREYSEMVVSSSADELDLMVADEKFLEAYFTCFSDGSGKHTKPPKPRLEYEGFDLTDMDLDETQLFSLLTLQPKGQS